MGFLEFFAKRVDDSSLVKSQSYSAAVAGQQPVRGTYSVTGNGFNALDSLSISSKKVAAQPRYRERDETAEGPHTAPHGVAPPRAGAWLSLVAGSSNTWLRDPPHVTLNGRLRTESLASSDYRRVAHHGTRSVLQQRPQDHTRSQSLTAATAKKTSKDILDAQSEFRPADFKSRVKAAGARDYGEDVADRNMGFNGLDLESAEAQAFYAEAAGNASHHGIFTTLSGRSDDLLGSAKGRARSLSSVRKQSSVGHGSWKAQQSPRRRASSEEHRLGAGIEFDDSLRSHMGAPQPRSPTGRRSSASKAAARAREAGYAANNRSRTSKDCTSPGPELHATGEGVFAIRTGPSQHHGSVHSKPALVSASEQIRLPRLEAASCPHRGLQREHARAQTVASTWRRKRTGHAVGDGPSKAGSLRNWSIASTTPPSSDTSSNAFQRLHSGQTMGTSVAISKTSSAKLSERRRSSCSSFYSHPQAVRNTLSSSFNMDDYISSDDDAHSTFGTRSCRPRGEGEEELLFRDDGYGMGAQLPGLFDSLATAATPAPMHPDHSPQALSGSGSVASLPAERRQWWRQKPACDGSEHDLRAGSDAGEDSDDSWSDWQQVLLHEHRLTSPPLPHQRRCSPVARFGGQGVHGWRPNGAAEFNKDDVITEEQDRTTIDVAAAVRLRKEKKTKERAARAVAGSVGRVGKSEIAFQSR